MGESGGFANGEAFQIGETMDGGRSEGFARVVFGKGVRGRSAEAWGQASLPGAGRAEASAYGDAHQRANALGVGRFGEGGGGGWQGAGHQTRPTYVQSAHGHAQSGDVRRRLGDKPPYPMRWACRVSAWACPEVPSAACLGVDHAECPAPCRHGFLLPFPGGFWVAICRSPLCNWAAKPQREG